MLVFPSGRDLVFPATDFINTRELTSSHIQKLLDSAAAIKMSPQSFSQALKGKSVLQFFIENSTRTRMSFEAAVRRLGGTSQTFVASSSSLSKGETLLDTANTILQYGVDLVVIRHPSSGAPQWLADILSIPVVNGGDGQHEHPTQALLDAFTLSEIWPEKQGESFQGKHILILGDILHSRVARSNIHCLTKLGVKVTLCAPQTLLPSDLSAFPKVDVVYRPEEVISKVDVVMCLRVQFERQTQSFFPSTNEYRHFWGLTVERAAQLKSDAVVLHPGPMNRGLEIDAEVADSSRSLILKQVENGMWMRMAILNDLIGSHQTQVKI